MNVFQERGITHLDLHGERHFDVDLIVLGISSKGIEWVSDQIIKLYKKC